MSDEMKALMEIVATVTRFAASSRKEYASTKEWTSTESHSCETIRVPVALLNRIRDAEFAAQCLIEKQKGE